MRDASGLGTRAMRRLRAAAGCGLLAVLAACAASGPATGPLTDDAAAGARLGAVGKGPATTDQGAREAAPAAEKAASAGAVLAEARQLRAKGNKREAMAALERASATLPADRSLTVEHGLLALELGELARATTLLQQAEAAGSRDWRVFSGLGVAHAAAGDHAEARRYFTRALEIAPGNASVLNNLAMSHVLAGRLDDAEPLLRRAARGKAPPTAGRNLALVRALKSNEGETGDPGQLATLVAPAQGLGERAGAVAALGDAATPPSPPSPPSAR